MDSTGLGALISGLRATRQAGSDLRIAGATAQVLSVLTMTRIDRVIRPYPSSRMHSVPGSSRTELSFRGPIEPASLDSTHDLLARLWQEQPDVPELDRIMFSTAVLEVANNIVSHGGVGTVSLVLNRDHQQLEARFCDDGAPVEVDPYHAMLPDDLAESGRGLALVRMAVDDFSYHHSDGFSRWHLVRRARCPDE